MSKIIQVQTVSTGDNINSEMKMVTTLLYDNGRVFQGCNEVIDGVYGEFVYGWVWNEITYPDVTNEK